MLVLETLEQAVKEVNKAIAKDIEEQPLERFRTKKRSYRWDGPIIKGS